VTLASGSGEEYRELANRNAPAPLKRPGARRRSGRSDAQRRLLRAHVTAPFGASIDGSHMSDLSTAGFWFHEGGT
jgi:hypothetical protein